MPDREQAIVFPDPAQVYEVVRAALNEDGAYRDLTTQALVPPGQQGRGTFVAKGVGVVAGLPVAAAVFAAVDEEIDFEPLVAEGARVEAGMSIATVAGPLAPILSGERIALNFLQRLSGIATETRAMADAVAGLPVRILDTRKTTPGLRALERYAVRVGGGQNHRFGLADGVLIKDNHLAAAQARGLSMADVIREARRAAPHTLRIEVEVTSVEQADAALAAGADIILLDNMSVRDMAEVVTSVRGRALIEASGGITLENVKLVAQTGVDFISSGALTHSPKALDISLEVEAGAGR